MARLEQSDERRPARRPLDGSARIGFRYFRTPRASAGEAAREATCGTVRGQLRPFRSARPSGARSTVRVVTNGYHCSSPSLSYRVDPTGHCAEGGGSEVLMQVTRSLSARIRKWLGLLGRKPAKTPYGAGAWGR
jgi:hypothetical protein